jgi:hypothetical protein
VPLILPGPATAQLNWIVGDDWSSDEWAVLIDGAPVTLTDPEWTVHGQVRDRDTGLVVAQWSTAVADPDTDGQVLLGAAAIPLPDGSFVSTSTARLSHSPTVSQRWGPSSGEMEVEVTRRAAGVITLNRTIVRGTARAEADVSQEAPA